MQWDAVCLSETRAPTGDVILDGGHRLISGLGDSRHLGVAILLRRQLADQVSRVHISSDRVIAVDVKVFGVNFQVVSAYAPHYGYGRGALQTF